MANLTREQRQVKNAEGDRLARQGYTRREIQAIIKEKYGETYHPRRFSPIYAERVAATVKRLEKQPAPKRKPSPEPEPQKLETKRRSTLLVPHYSRPTRTLQGRLYRRFRAAGYSPVEAIPMEKYWKLYNPPGGGKKQLPPFVLAMLENRMAMKEAHNIEARAKGWGVSRSNAEFAKKIKKLYENLPHGKEKPFVDEIVIKARGSTPSRRKKVKPFVNVWALKEATINELPDDMKWDTPRHWAISQPVKAAKAAKRYAKIAMQKEIEKNQELIDRRGDPSGNLTWAINDLKGKLARGEYGY